jgi:AcrR family transcriptional regulator
MAEGSKKQEIMEAAARLFRDKGYSATSMRDLAKAVNLKASSLYNHIGSKEEILQIICFENARRFLDAMKKVEQSEDTITEKIEALIHFHIQVATEDVTSVTAFNDEWRHLSGEELDRFKGLRKDYEERFKHILKAGMEKGVLKDSDPTVTLYTLLSAVRWLHDWYRSGGTKTPADISKTITTLLLRGLSR